MNAYLVYDLTLEGVGLEEEKLKFNKRVNNLSVRIGVGKALVAKRPSRTSMGFAAGKKSLAISQATSRSGNSGRPDRPDRSKKPNFLQKQKSQREMIQRANGGNKLKNKRSIADGKQYKGKMTLKQLKDIVRNNQYDEYGMDPDTMEEYLTDEEFKVAFGVDRITFILMPWYKQKELKSKAGLKKRPTRKPRGL